jgi:hypothetical protein
MKWRAAALTIHSLAALDDDRESVALNFDNAQTT